MDGKLTDEGILIIIWKVREVNDISETSREVLAFVRILSGGQWNLPFLCPILSKFDFRYISKKSDNFFYKNGGYH